MQVSADSVGAYHNTSGASSTDAGPSASSASLQSSTHGAHPHALFSRMRNMSLDERRISHGVNNSAPLSQCDVMGLIIVSRVLELRMGSWPVPYFSDVLSPLS